MSKKCSRCGDTKDIEQFYKHKPAKDGRQSACKSCILESQRVYRETNPESKRERDRKYRAGLPKHVKSHRDYKARANRKGVDFELQEFDFQVCQMSPCEYCGDQAKGFDRLDSSKGYVYENVTPCCTDCNMMKKDMTYEQFISRVRKINSNSEQLF